MKLKLEVQEGTTILSVTETVSAEHAAILRAGLAKLFQSGKKALLLDLTGASADYDDFASDLAGIQAVAPDHEASLMVAARIPGVSGAGSRDEDLRTIKTPLFGLLSQEAILQAKLRKLEAEKSGLETALASSQGDESEARALRLDFSRLKGVVAHLEGLISRALATRQPPADAIAVKTKIDTIERTLVALLEQEGVLPVA